MYRFFFNDTSHQTLKPLVSWQRFWWKDGSQVTKRSKISIKHLNSSFPKNCSEIPYIWDQSGMCSCCWGIRAIQRKTILMAIFCKETSEYDDILFCTCSEDQIFAKRFWESGSYTSQNASILCFNYLLYFSIISYSIISYTFLATSS